MLWPCPAGLNGWQGTPQTEVGFGCKVVPSRRVIGVVLARAVGLYEMWRRCESFTPTSSRATHSERSPVQSEPMVAELWGLICICPTACAWLQACA